MTAPAESSPAVSTTTWARFSPSQVAAILATTAVLLVVTIPMLPPGICTGDSGDLQVSATTLGIAHPPGYSGYVAIGFLFTKIPLLDPTYSVSIACLLAGVIALLLCMAFQIRLGVNEFIAGAIVLALASHSRFWINLVIPEVYAPSMAFVAGSGYMLLRYASRRRQVDLMFCALMLGIAVSNRPPAALMIPAFALAWWIANLEITKAGRTVAATHSHTQNGSNEEQSSLAGVEDSDGESESSTPPPKPRTARMATLLGATCCLLLPCVLSIAYVAVRDQPGPHTNYIEQYNRETNELPSADDGLGARWQRCWWLISGSQYKDKLEPSLKGLGRRLTFIRNRIAPLSPRNLILVAAIVLLGCYLGFRRSVSAAIVLLGIFGSSLAFLVLYRIYGDAADMLPILWSLAVFLGLALGAAVNAIRGQRYRMIASVTLFIAACIWTFADAPSRWHPGDGLDATPLLAEVHMSDIEEDTVIVSAWDTSPPLWYEQLVVTKRDDVRIINAHPAGWIGLVDKIFSDSSNPQPTVYLATEIDMPSAYTLDPERGLHRVRATTPARDAPSIEP